MRHYIRSNTPGATYFFTLVLQDRGSDLLVRHAELLRGCIVAVRERHPFRVDAMVVLPDHLHAIWSLPAEDADFGTRWMLVKAGFTRGLARAGALEGRPGQTRGKAGERQLWQRRYWEHQVRDDADFARHVDYIHFNPVKHGYAAAAGDWPHSSFHRYVRAGLLAPDWGVGVGGEGAFGERRE